MRHTFILLLTLLTLFPLTARSQVVVEARMDTAAILIGEQVQVRVKCSAGAKQHVALPIYEPGQMLTPGVEVVDNGRTDTVLTNDGKRMELTRRYTITSFDSALYSLPPFVVQVDGKAYPSRGSLGLKVNTVAVDTVHVDKFNGPHDVVDQPFLFTWRQTLLSLLDVLLLLVCVALAVRLADPRLITRRVVIHPPTPAHVTALRDIEKIKSATRADTKQYYMALTETLRTYLQTRFGFNAHEMTSSEIIEALTSLHSDKAVDELRNILLTADLVKFAKHSPSLPEQDRNLVEALDYVQTTKLVPQVQPKPRVEYVSLSNRRQLFWRNVMRIGVWFTGIGSTGLWAYLVYDLYCCFG